MVDGQLAGVLPFTTRVADVVELVVLASPDACGAAGAPVLADTEHLIAWLGDAANGIGKFSAGEVHAKDGLCVGSTCVTETSSKQW